jgi:hypothetical protein
MAQDRHRHLPDDRRLRDRQPGDQPDRGVVSTAVLLGWACPFAVALGLLVAILDLIPLAGATIAAILVSTVAFLDSTRPA